MDFFHSLPVPEFWEWDFFIPFPFPKFGNGFFYSLPVPEFREWAFSIPFPFPNFGNGLFQFPSRSRTLKSHSRSPLNLSLQFHVRGPLCRPQTKSHCFDKVLHPFISKPTGVMLTKFNESFRFCDQQLTETKVGEDPDEKKMPHYELVVN